MVIAVSRDPSIVLGLFALTLVQDLAWGRCILSSGVALAVMILPFIEVGAEKTFQSLQTVGFQSSMRLGCTGFYTIWKVRCRPVRGDCRV